MNDTQKMRDSVKLYVNFSCWLIGKLNFIFPFKFQSYFTLFKTDHRQLLVPQLPAVLWWTHCKKEAGPSGFLYESSCQWFGGEIKDTGVVSRW